MAPRVERVEHADALALADPLVLRAEARGDVDEPGPLGGIDHRVEDDPVASGPGPANGNGGAYERPASSWPVYRRTTSAPEGRYLPSAASARISSLPSEARIPTYASSARAATSRFAGSVQGVVVQTKSLRPSARGNRTVTDGSVVSRYPWATSWEESGVSQRGQYGRT